MVVFRSILMSLKAAPLNLVSIGAAYGVIVVIFQWGWGRSLLGIEGSIPVVSVPMMMFAVLFGLSMDYEVFLLSRVREEYLRTGNNVQSVVTGISTTARGDHECRTDHDRRLPEFRDAACASAVVGSMLSDRIPRSLRVGSTFVPGARRGPSRRGVEKTRCLGSGGRDE
jgi:hypothetical protein